MPITVNYNPDIELLGDVSFDTGRGLAYLRERQRQEALRQLEKQRQDQLRAQDIDRFDRYNFDYMNRVDAGEGRAAQEFQNALARQQQERQFLTEQDRLAEDSRRRYELDQMQLEGVERSRQDEAGLRQQQRDYYIQSIEQKRQQQEAQEEQWRQEQAMTHNGEWQLSESDKTQKDAELQQIQQFSQFLLPQEYEQAIQEHDRRWRGKEKLVAPQKTPQQEVEGNTYVDERIPGKPIVWHKDKDGSWRPTPIEKEKEGQDEAKINEAALRFAEKVQDDGSSDATRLAELTAWRFQYAKAVLTGQEPPPPPPEAGQDGTTQPPPAAQPAPEPTPEPTDTEAIWQTIPDQQKQQVVDLIQQIKVAMQSGDDVSAEQLKAQLADLYRQLGIMQ